MMEGFLSSVNIMILAFAEQKKEVNKMVRRRKGKQGFAGMSKAKRTRIARKGGKSRKRGRR